MKGKATPEISFFQRQVLFSGFRSLRTSSFPLQPPLVPILDGLNRSSNPVLSVSLDDTVFLPASRFSPFYAFFVFLPCTQVLLPSSSQNPYFTENFSTEKCNEGTPSRAGKNEEAVACAKVKWPPRIIRSPSSRRCFLADVPANKNSQPHNRTPVSSWYCQFHESRNL